jgi:hypothetical protein
LAWKRNILVVANVTATSEQLLAALQERAKRESAAYTLVVPATPFGGGREAAAQQLAQALAKLRDGGLEADGSVGAGDPIVAVTDVWDPKRFDEIIVSTLPMRFSKWLHAGLPERIGKLTGASITHLVAESPEHQVEPVPVPAHEKGPMGPLTVLGWGGRKEQ